MEKQFIDACMNTYMNQKTYNKALNPYKSIKEAKKLCKCVYDEIKKNKKNQRAKALVKKCSKQKSKKRKSKKRKSKKRKSKKRKSKKRVRKRKSKRGSKRGSKKLKSKRGSKRISKRMKRKKFNSGLRSNKNYILEISTPNTRGNDYGKRKDSNDDIDALITAANNILEVNHVVKIHMVIPDSHYPKSHHKSHQGHTFVLTRDNKKLTVYDNSESGKYTSTESYYDNYRKVINKLAGRRPIYFFPVNYQQFKTILDQSEGACSAYIRALQGGGLIKVPPKRRY